MVMTLKEANNKIKEIADKYGLKTATYSDSKFLTGKETGEIATFRVLTNYVVGDGRHVYAKPLFLCCIREMSDYTVSEMLQISYQCKAVAECVEELDYYFSGADIIVDAVES